MSGFRWFFVATTTIIIGFGFLLFLSYNHFNVETPDQLSELNEWSNLRLIKLEKKLGCDHVVADKTCSYIEKIFEERLNKKLKEANDS